MFLIRGSIFMSVSDNYLFHIVTLASKAEQRGENAPKHLFAVIIYVMEYKQTKTAEAKLMYTNMRSDADTLTSTDSGTNVLTQAQTDSIR